MADPRNVDEDELRIEDVEVAASIGGRPANAEKPRESRKLTRLRELAANRGGKLLSARRSRDYPLRWECRASHKWLATEEEVIRDGRWCDECDESRAGESAGEARCRRIIEGTLGAAFPRQRPGFLLREATGRLLELDGYNAKMGLAFEHHGQQHYRYVEFFHRTAAAHGEMQERDREKKELCELHQVALIVIPYYVDPGPFIRRRLEEMGYLPPEAGESGSTDSE